MQVPAVRIVSGDSSWMVPLAIIGLIVVGVLWVMQRARDAKDKQARHDAATQGHDIGAFQAGAQAQGAATLVPPSLDAAADSRERAWAALFDPSTPATRLAEIATAHPEFAARLAAHPNAYPDLIVWAQRTGTTS